MADLNPCLYDQPEEVQHILRLLRQRGGLATTLGELDSYLGWRCPNPQVVIPLLLPVLEEALARTDFTSDERAPTADRMRPAFTSLGPGVGRLARSPHAAVRLAVAEALERMDPPASSAAESVARLLDDPVAEVRARACRALARVRPTHESARLLLRRLDDPDEEVVCHALLALGEVGPEAGEAVPHLLRFLEPAREPRSAHLLHALQALLDLPVGPELLPHFLPLCQRDWGAECESGLLLGARELRNLSWLLERLGPLASPCVPDLERVLHLPDEVIYGWLKGRVAAALLRIAGENDLARQTFERLAASEDVHSRRAVVEELGKRAVPFKESFHGLLQRLSDDPEDEVRKGARSALGQALER